MVKCIKLLLGLAPSGSTWQDGVHPVREYGGVGHLAGAARVGRFERGGGMSWVMTVLWCASSVAVGARMRRVGHVGIVW